VRILYLKELKDYFHIKVYAIYVKQFLFE